MLTDISGNTFSLLSNESSKFNIPTITYNPKQLFGNDLFCWVDSTDYRALYTTTAGTTNISPTGNSVVNRMEDLAGTFTGSNNSRKFYHFAGTVVSPVELSANSTSNVWCGQTLDTNRGKLSYNTRQWYGHGGNFETSNPLNQLGKSKSAATVCFFGIVNGTGPGGTAQALGLSIANFSNGLIFGTRMTGLQTYLDFNVVNSSYTNSNTVFRYNNFINYFNRNIMVLFTVTGNTFYAYINNDLISSGTMTNYNYPFTSTSFNNPWHIAYNTGFGLSPQALNLQATYESFIVDNYTTQQQVNLIYNYFRVKYKDRRIY